MIEEAIFATTDELGIGNVYWGAAPEKETDAEGNSIPVPLPYVVLDPPPSSGSDEYDTEHVGTEPLRLRFHVFADGLQAARNALKKIEKAFVFGDIGVDDGDGTMLAITKVADDVSLDPEPNPDGDVWHAVLDLDALIARTPGQ